MFKNLKAKYPWAFRIKSKKISYLLVDRRTDWKSYFKFLMEG